MSYILEALRRAENERERERKGLPSLHSQLHEQAQATEEADDDSSAADVGKGRVWNRLAWGLGLGLTLGGLALWAWSRLGTAPTPDSAAVVTGGPVAPQPMPPAPPVVAPVTAAVVAPTAPAPSPPTASAPQLVPLPAVLPDAPKKAVPPAKPERKPATQPPIQAPIQPHELGSSETTPPQRKAPAQPAGENRPIRSLGQLPEGVRRELPPLAVSGSMYSPQPAARMLVLDGQVAREGDELRPGLSIETIEPKSAILNFRGERFRLNY